MNDHHFYVRSLHLQTAAKSTLMCHAVEAYAPNNKAALQGRAEDARTSVIMALSGVSSDKTREEARDALIVLIADAIQDSIEIDWTSEDAAIAVLNEILEAVAPMPKEEVDA